MKRQAGGGQGPPQFYQYLDACLPTTILASFVLSVSFNPEFLPGVFTPDVPVADSIVV